MPLDGNPGWTEDRVERCTSLWMQGYSASQIANALGWVSRNAVIGKLKRLGKLGKERDRHQPATVISFPRSRATVRRSAPRFVPAEQPPAALAIVPRIVQELNIPTALRVDLLDLREGMCRFPIGDPRDDAFHFCGCRQAAGTSYCGHHARIATRPSAPRQPSFFRLEALHG